MVTEYSTLEVFLTFLKLGLTSFGGPIAHIGYFREELVIRRRWVGDATYTDLVALCQFLPGPASSQVGFSLGLIRAGYWGGLAAWAAFTLPSAVLMTAFAYVSEAFIGPIETRLLHALQLVAVAVVAQAVWGMARSLCPDRGRASIAGLAAILIVLYSSSSLAQGGVILVGGLAGLWLCRGGPAASAGVPPTASVSRRVGTLALCAYVLLLAVLPLIGRLSPRAQLFNAFYRSGALVFGGGHVVLPLLKNAFVVPGWLSENSFLAGYGATQAVPGPLFTFAAYLGAVTEPTSNRVMGALAAVIAIFLPGMLVLLAALPFWAQLRQQGWALAGIRGVNAATVGLLGAALYYPLWTSTIQSSADVAMAVAGTLLLIVWRMPPWRLVVSAIAYSLLV